MGNEKSLYQRHHVELISALFGISLSVFGVFANLIDEQTSWICGVLSAVSAILAAIIKDNSERQHQILINKIDLSFKETHSFNKMMAFTIEIFAKLDGNRLKYAESELKNFRKILNSINNGRIRLNESEYYEKIIHRMKTAEQGLEILATSTMDERRWESDSRQLNYMSANDLAIKNGAKIKRIFIVNKHNLDDPRYQKGLSEIHQQIISKEIEAHVVWRHELPTKEELIKDWVMFDSADPEIYQAYPDDPAGSPHRIWWAELIVGSDRHGNDNSIPYRQDFKQLFSFVTTSQNFYDEWQNKLQLRSKSMDLARTNRLPIGSDIQPKILPHPVYSCKEAAAAKKIPLSKELKTVIFRTTNGIIAVHVCGNHKISNRKIKNVLSVDEAYMASRDDLDILGVTRGTVTPSVPSIWRLNHLVDYRVFENDFVSSNNGTVTGYYIFDPNQLKNAAYLISGDFIVTENEQELN